MPIDTDTFSLDYDSRSGNYVADFHGLTIKAVREDSAENPWENWDGQVPMAYASWDRNSYGGGDNPAVHDSGFDILDPFRHMTDGFLTRHQAAIAEIIHPGYALNTDELKTDAQWYGNSLPDQKRSYFRDCLRELSSVRKLQRLDAIYDLMKIPHYLGTTRGYSQGDELEVLCVAFPAWCETCGAPKDYSRESFKGDVDLLGAWAWGDVYGYVIEHDGEQLDSCWGFYGRDFDKSGLQEEALSAARYEAKKLIKAEAAEIEETRPDMYAD